MTNVSVSRVESLREISTEEWAEVARGKGLYHSHPWLLSTENHPSYAVSYFLARDDRGALVGALPVYVPVGNGGSVWYDPSARFLRAMGFPEAEWRPTILGGTRAGYHNEILVRPDREEALRRIAMKALTDRFLDLADELGARSAALMYMVPRDVRSALRALPEHTWSLLSDANASIEVRWDSFEGYLASLPSRRRSNVRREVKLFSDPDLSLSTAPLGECYQEIAPLATEHLRRYGSAITADLMEKRLAEQVAYLDGVSRVILCRKGRGLVGFALFYEWEKHLYARMVGMSTDAKRYAAYFNLTYYQPLRQATEEGLRQLHLGPDSYEAKLLRGARLLPLWSVVTERTDEPARRRAAADGWNRRESAALAARVAPFVDRFDPALWLTPAAPPVTSGPEETRDEA